MLHTTGALTNEYTSEEAAEGNEGDGYMEGPSEKLFAATGVLKTLTTLIMCMDENTQCDTKTNSTTNVLSS
jgi:hypothetical protein